MASWRRVHYVQEHVGVTGHLILGYFNSTRQRRHDPCRWHNQFAVFGNFVSLERQRSPGVQLMANIAGSLRTGVVDKDRYCSQQRRGLYQEHAWFVTQQRQP